MSSGNVSCGLAILLTALLASGAVAQPADPTPTAAKEPQTADKPSATANPPSIQSSLGPFGDPGGIRGSVSSKGIEYRLTYIGEVLGNVSGGVRRGTIYQGSLDMQVDADLDKLFGWQGAAFHTNFYQIHGTGLSRYYVDNLLTTSGIEALPSSRLYELWLEQQLLGGQVAIRAGQLAADTEFFISETASLFVNATFGWPGITAENLPSGGPAYPLATPAVRVKMAPNDQVSLLVGVFNGDPAGRPNPFGDTDPQRLNRTGTNFRLSDPALLIVEGAYAYNQGKDAPGLPGTVKLGSWHHFGRFADQRFDAAGFSLADPATSGVARRLRGNDGIYGIIDQAIYRVPGTDDQGASAFARLSVSPGDRNLVDFYADAGMTYKGLIPGRPNDTFGVGAAYLRISDRVRDLDRDTIFFTNSPMPVRKSEALIEITYQAEIMPGWTVQPDFQYVFRPGAGIANPRTPNGTRTKDAAIFGARTTIRY